MFSSIGRQVSHHYSVTFAKNKAVNAVQHNKLDISKRTGQLTSNALAIPNSTHIIKVFWFRLSFG